MSRQDSSPSAPRTSRPPPPIYTAARAPFLLLCRKLQPPPLSPEFPPPTRSAAAAAPRSVTLDLRRRRHRLPLLAPLLPDPVATPEDRRSSDPDDPDAVAASFSGDVDAHHRGKPSVLLVRILLPSMLTAKREE